MRYTHGVFDMFHLLLPGLSLKPHKQGEIIGIPSVAFPCNHGQPETLLPIDLALQNLNDSSNLFAKSKKFLVDAICMDALISNVSQNIKFRVKQCFNAYLAS